MFQVVLGLSFFSLSRRVQFEASFILPFQASAIVGLSTWPKGPRDGDKPLLSPHSALPSPAGLVRWMKTDATCR